MSDIEIEERAESLFKEVCTLNKEEAFEFIRKTSYFNSYYNQPPIKQAIKELAREKWEKSQ